MSDSEPCESSNEAGRSYAPDFEQRCRVETRRRALQRHPPSGARRRDCRTQNDVQERRRRSADLDHRDWIESASKVFAGKPATFRGYANAVRLIASEILAVSKNQQRFAQNHAEIYRRKIDSFSLAILTPESIQAWRISYVAKVGNNPARQRAARISCNSTLRAAKALFGRKILKFTSASLPEPIPFSQVEFYPRESMRYHSKIDPVALLQAASQELAESDSDAFKALILALGAGLRRGEIDTCSGVRWTSGPV